MESYAKLMESKDHLSYLNSLIGQKEQEVKKFSKKFRKELADKLFPKGLKFLHLKVAQYPFVSRDYALYSNEDASVSKYKIGDEVKHIVTSCIESHGEVQVVLPKIPEVLEWINKVNKNTSLTDLKIKRAKDFNIGIVGMIAMPGKNIHKTPKKDYISVIITFLEN